LLPGQVWHITHRCHQREFLLKFGRDRQRWRYWLFEARKRFGLSVLNYVVTSNHVHLLVVGRGQGEIARSMQLIAGGTAQEYNQRKQRRGAYWEDRYHATAVDTDGYLARCMTYIDMNRVRAGAVSHPANGIPVNSAAAHAALHRSFRPRSFVLMNPIRRQLS
jgi:putative transposase